MGASEHQQRKSLLVWLIIGIFGGGLVEELQRIFIITRFEKWLGKYGLAASVVLSSISFGHSHLYQGMNAAIGIGILGVINCLIYLRKRSAIEVITCHAVFDVIGMLLVYFVGVTHPGRT